MHNQQTQPCNVGNQNSSPKIQGFNACINNNDVISCNNYRQNNNNQINENNKSHKTQNIIVTPTKQQKQQYKQIQQYQLSQQQQTKIQIKKSQSKNSNQFSQQRQRQRQIQRQQQQQWNKKQRLAHSPSSDIYEKQPLKKNKSIREPKEKITFKIVVVGQSFVGKTSLIRRFVNNPKINKNINNNSNGKSMANQYCATVGVDFLCKSLYLPQSQFEQKQPVFSADPPIDQSYTQIQFQIWDTCGHDLYRSMTTSFYRGASCIFLVFSLDNRQSFNQVLDWHREWQEHGSPQALVVIIGTKADLEHQVQMNEGMTLMRDIGGLFYVETSAYTGLQIWELFTKSAQLMYKKYQISQQYRMLVQPRKHNQSIMLGENANGEAEGDIAESGVRPKRKCC